jgi:hypothetical protein
MPTPVSERTRQWRAREKQRTAARQIAGLLATNALQRDEDDASGSAPPAPTFRQAVEDWLRQYFIKRNIHPEASEALLEGIRVIDPERGDLLVWCFDQPGRQLYLLTGPDQDYPDDPRRIAAAWFTDAHDVVLEMHQRAGRPWTAVHALKDTVSQMLRVLAPQSFPAERPPGAPLRRK